MFIFSDDYSSSQNGTISPTYAIPTSGVTPNGLSRALIIPNISTTNNIGSGVWSINFTNSTETDLVFTCLYNLNTTLDMSQSTTINLHVSQLLPTNVSGIYLYATINSQTGTEILISDVGTYLINLSEYTPSVLANVTQISLAIRVERNTDFSTYDADIQFNYLYTPPPPSPPCPFFDDFSLSQTNQTTTDAPTDGVIPTSCTRYVGTLDGAAFMEIVPYSLIMNSNLTPGPDDIDFLLNYTFTSQIDLSCVSALNLFVLDLKPINCNILLEYTLKDVTLYEYTQTTSPLTRGIVSLPITGSLLLNKSAIINIEFKFICRQILESGYSFNMEIADGISSIYEGGALQ